MNRNRIVTILLVIFSFFSFFFLFNYSKVDIFAQTSCPSNMESNSEECFNYLNEQLSIIKGQIGTIENRLKEEEYQQLSLNEKISYTNNQIKQTENAIKSLEIEIASHDIEINLLKDEISRKEDDMSVLGQEISVLQDVVTRRVSQSYKYSFVRPLELLFDVTNLSSILRKTKYLSMTRNQDLAYLEEYNSKVNTVKEEEELLTIARGELQTVRNKIEEEKNELAEERIFLSDQKREREYLLALSKAKQAELLAELKKNKAIQTDLDSKILAYINANMGNMTKVGPVAKGGKIGYVYPAGNACSGSTGPHLHFAASTLKSYYFAANVDLYKQGYLRMGAPSGKTPAADGWDWKFLLPGKFAVPMVGPGVYITQDYHDLNFDYIQDANEPHFYATDISKLGGSANAVVVAAEAGHVERGVDYCNQDYVIIYHPDKENYTYRTIYVHLKFSQ